MTNGSCEFGQHRSSSGDRRETPQDVAGGGQLRGGAAYCRLCNQGGEPADSPATVFLLHAYRNATDAYALEEGLVMLVGPARTGALLEIGVVRSEEGTPVIVHVMEARPRFLR